MTNGVTWCVRVALLGRVPRDELDDVVRRVRAPHARRDARGRALRSAHGPAAGGTVLAATVVPRGARVRDRAGRAGGVRDHGAGREGRRSGSADLLHDGFSLVAWAAAEPGGPGPVPGPWPWDEHVVVDADEDGVRRWHDQADVLMGTRPQPSGRSLRVAEELSGAHCGCLLAAVPRLDGGWSVASPGGRARRVRTVCQPSEAGGGRSGGCEGGPGPHGHRHALLPSCLHGWLVAGGALGELESATVVLRC